MGKTRLWRSIVYSNMSKYLLANLYTYVEIAFSIKSYYWKYYYNPISLKLLTSTWLKKNYKSHRISRLHPIHIFLFIYFIIQIP